MNILSYIAKEIQVQYKWSSINSTTVNTKIYNKLVVLAFKVSMKLYNCTVYLFTKIILQFFLIVIKQEPTLNPAHEKALVYSHCKCIIVTMFCLFWKKAKWPSVVLYLYRTRNNSVMLASNVIQVVNASRSRTLRCVIISEELRGLQRWLCLLWTQRFRKRNENNETNTYPINTHKNNHLSLIFSTNLLHTNISKTSVHFSLQ